ncbi:MAG: Ig-like domain-containing protein [Gemmatimonadaceae bacterium]
MPPPTSLCSRLVVLGTALVAACGGGGETTAPTFTLQAFGTVPSPIAAGSPVDSMRVRVVDGSGNPKPGVSVSFVATSGAASVSPATAVTDAQGRAAARLLTDVKVGVNTATATIAGAAPVTFSVTTIAGSAKTISIKERIAIADAGQRISPTITAVDANGNVVPNTQITFTARTPAIVSITSDGGIVGIALSQTFVVASSDFASDSILVVVTNPNGPVLETDMTRLDVAHDTSFTVPIVLDMRTSGEKLGATTVTIRWDPSQLSMVSQADGATGVGAFVNATTAAQGTLTMAVASAAGFAGRIELRRITFKAASAAGKAGNLQLSASELSGAGTFTDLLAKTTAVTYPLSTR